MSLNERIDMQEPVVDRATLDAIRSWRYKPVNFHGHPVDVPVRTLIRFVLPK